MFSILKLLYFPLSVTISFFLRNICLRGPVIECKLIKQLWCVNNTPVFMYAYHALVEVWVWVATQRKPIYIFIFHVWTCLYLNSDKLVQIPGREALSNRVAYILKFEYFGKYFGRRDLIMKWWVERILRV